MDMGLALLIAVVVALQTWIALSPRRRIAHRSRFKASCMLSASSIAPFFAVVVGFAGVSIDRDFILFGVAFAVISFMLLCAAVLLMFLSLDALNADPQTVTKKQVRAKVAPEDSAAPNGGSYSTLYWAKKREVARLRERVQQLEGHSYADVGDDERDDEDSSDDGVEGVGSRPSAGSHR